MEYCVNSKADELLDGATWRWDIQTETLHVSEGMSLLLNRSIDSLKTPVDLVANSWRDGVSEQDLSNKEQIEAFCANFVKAVSVPAIYELTFLTADRKRWLWLRGEAKLDIESGGHVLVGRLDDVTNLLRSAEQATERARLDEMSGLLRREHLVRTMKTWMVPNPKLPVYFFVLIAIDLDGLSIINNHYGGHAAGDDVIQSFGKNLQRLQTDDVVVGRMGGDEFAVFARCRTSEDFESLLNATHLTTRYPHTFADHVQGETRQIQVSAAIGVASRATSADPEEDSLELMRQADDALYISKRNKDQQYVIFTPEMKADIERERSNRLVLSETLRESSLPLAWMPIINLESGRIIGAEVLLDDITKNQMGAKSNEEVIQSLRDLALLEDHDLGNLFSAMQEIAAINELYPSSPLYLSVNLSPNNLVGKNGADPSNIVETIESLLKWTNFPPHLLHIEISEDAQLRDTVHIHSVLGELKRLGIRLVCDDFGKNYSNLDRLLCFPEFDVYKLDMALTDHLLSSNDKARKAVLMQIKMLLMMGKEVCAEGVENVEQYYILKNVGCTTAQGFLFCFERSRSGGKLSTERFHEMLRGNGIFHWINEI